MDCNSASILMMKYMDKVLTENEAEYLNAHILSCVVCKEDFALYECIVEEFETSSTSLFAPPDSFEAQVMEKIAHITPAYGTPYSSDGVVGFVFGLFSMLFGLGVIFSLNRVEIMAFGAKYPYVGELMERAAVFSDSASITVSAFGNHMAVYINNAASLIEAAKYGILAIIAGLVAVQLIVYTKNKVEI